MTKTAIDSISMRANPRFPNANRWQDRHNGAVDLCIGRKSFESAMVAMLHGWVQYAVDHHARYESLIGDDGVLGKEWQAIGLGIRGLLNGDCGPRLDCGTLDAFILNTLQANGCEIE